MEFEWNEDKNIINQQKHNISFNEAQYAFLDKARVITKDIKHSTEEECRYFCFGLIGYRIVRFVIRKNKIRIFGAGYWREGVKKYDKKNGL